MNPRCLPPGGLKVLRQLGALAKKRGLILAGGTALALHLGHRKSVDLDFFSDVRFSNDDLLAELEEMGMKLAVLQEEEDTLTVLIDKVKVSFFYYPYPFVTSATEYQGIDVAGIQDIASMKMMAIVQRGTKRDFIDLYFVLKSVPFDEVAKNLIARYGKERINPLIIGKALTYFDDAESDPEPSYCGRERPDWSMVKKYFLKNLRAMIKEMS